MDFAPYQDAPENSRDGASFPPEEHPPPMASNTQNKNSRLPSPGDFENNVGVNPASCAGFGNGLGSDERNYDVFSTSLPMRVDVEAMIAYLLLPPAGCAVLLMFEHKSDYVRFHAWQSGLLFTCLFLIHVIFSFTKVVSFMLLVVDLTLILFLTYHAWKDSDTLDRYEIPWFGQIASNFVDAE